MKYVKSSEDSIKNIAVKEGDKFYLHLNSNDFVLTQYTALCSLPLKDNKWVYSELADYINTNHEFFTNEVIKKSARTFIGAHVYKNHEPSEGNKGIVLDVALRNIDIEGHNVIYVDITSATSRLKDEDLYKRVKSGDVCKSSMGAVSAYSVCSVCGQMSNSMYDVCEHQQPMILGRKCFCPECNEYVPSAAIFGHQVDDEHPNFTFFEEQSWIYDGEVPAFKGAVLRNVLDIPRDTEIIVEFPKIGIIRQAVKDNFDVSQLDPKELAVYKKAYFGDIIEVEDIPNAFWC